MKHKHVAEVPCPTSEAHRTCKRVRLRCDAVYVASVVTEHSWTQEAHDWTRPTKWTRTIGCGPTSYFIIYLKNAYQMRKWLFFVFFLPFPTSKPPLLHVVASVSPFAACLLLVFEGLLCVFDFSDLSLSVLPHLFKPL